MRRLRPGDSSSWVTLPSRGLSPAPPWPQDIDRPSATELSIWHTLWLNQPQAHVWAATGMHVTVAVYVRMIIRASSRDASAAEVTQYQRLTDALLLSPAALRGSRYIIEVSGATGGRTLPGVRSAAPVVGIPGARAGSGVLSRLAPVPDVADDEGD